MPSDPASPRPHLPKEVAGYSVTRMLGEGGMSVVYAAMQREPKRMVALKILKGSTFPPSALRRFKREIEILGKLRHPGIAQVYDAGTWDDGTGEKPYFVMEYIPGGRELLDYIEERKLSLEQRLKLFVRICAAVDHGHKRKIVHRDLKPGNILVDENGDVKVIDYGVARVSEVEVNSQTMHTEAGRLVGTVQYMAPEQVDMAMQDIDTRCDVYSLGVLLYQVCTGTMPHELDGQPIFEAMRTIREDAPPSPRQSNSEVDRDLETIIFKCLEKERGRRYTRAGELGRDLLRYLRNEPIEARRASMSYRVRLGLRRHRTIAISSVVILFVLVAAAAVIVFLPSWVNRQREETLLSQVDTAQQQQAEAEAERDEARQQGTPRQWVPQQPYVLKGLGSRVNACVIDPTGSSCCAITATSTGIWTLPDARRWTEGDTGELHPGHIAYARNGTVLAISGRSEIACINLQTGEGHRWELPRRKPASLAVSDDGTMVALGFDDFSLSLYGIEGGRITRTTSSSGMITHLDFGTSDQGPVLVGVSDERLTMWEVGTKLVTRSRFTIPGGILAVAVNSGATAAQMMTETGTLVTCPLSGDSASVQRRGLVSEQVKQVAFDADAGHVLIVEEGSMSVWSLDTMQPETPQMPLAVSAGIYALGPGGTMFAHADRVGTVTVTPLN